MSNEQRKQRNEDIEAQLAEPHVRVPHVDLAVWISAPRHDVPLSEAWSLKRLVKSLSPKCDGR